MGIIRLETEKDRVVNLSERIYFLCYGKPHWVGEISELLYGENSGKKKSSYSKVSVRTTELHKQKKMLIKLGEREISNILSNGVINGNIDGRVFNRTYYLADCNPVVSKIKKTESLTSFEEYVIRDKFDSKFFRNMIDNFTYRVLENLPFYAIDYIISRMDLLFLSIDENIDLRELSIHYSNNISSKSGYDNKLKQIEQDVNSIDPRTINKIVKRSDNIIKYVGGRSPTKTTQSYSKEKLREFLKFIVIPESIFKKILSISPSGKDYHEMKNMMKYLSELTHIYQTKFNIL